MTDAEARNIIINELKKNIFVVAGAGSGKTSMLVNRMVALIESGETTIDKICAITFTVNAAAEFLERLRKTLKRRSLGNYLDSDSWPGGLGKITEDIKSRDKTALLNIDLCFAGTIDAFCNLILSEYPINAKIPSSSSVLDDKEASILYKKEYARLAELYKDNESYKAFVRLFKNPSSTFSNAIELVIDASFLNVQYEKPVKSLDEFIKDFKNKYEASLKADIKQISNSDSVINDKSKAVIEKYHDFLNLKAKYLTNWNLNTILDLSKLEKILKVLTFKDDPYVSNLVNYEIKDGKKLYSYQEDCLFEDAIKEIELMKFSFAIDFLLSCAQEVRQELKNKGKLTFNEYLFTFKEMVKEDMYHGMSLINHIRKKYTHFLIDESQDTSPFQYELFLFLNSKKPVNSIDDVDLIPGSVFIVGDPKQSIYRFRNADISSYNRVRRIFENNKDNLVVELTNNYRCSNMLCHYFNDRFKDMDDFTPIANADKDVKECEGLYTFTDYIEVIKTIIDNPAFTIKDNKGNDRTLTYKDIMIISKSKTGKLSEIAKRLDEEKMPYFTEGDNVLSNYPGAEVVYAIYSYLAYNREFEYKINLLTSPIFGLNKLEAIAFNDNALEMRKEHRDLLSKIESLKKDDNPVSLLKNIIDNMDLFTYIKNQRMDYVYYLLNLLEDAYASNEVLSLVDGANFLKEKMLEPQERIAQLMYKPNAIYVANVHKVKGLEAPVVIMIKSGANNASKNTIEKHMDYQNGKSYLFRLSKQEFGGASFYDAFDTFTHPELIEEEDKQSKKEFERLQYVAVTRARNLLFIDGASKHNVWFDLINENFKEFISSDYPKNENDSNIEIEPFVKLNGKFKKEATYDIVLPSKLKLDHEGNSDEIEIKDQFTSKAAEKGTLIHALLEIYLTSNMKYAKKDLVSETLARFNMLDKYYYRKMLNDVFDTMNSGGFIQASGEREDLFSILKSASEIYSEMPFSYKEGDNIYNGSIDLLYKLNDKYYIVDYKTNYDDDNLDEKYALQLKAYQKAIKDIIGVDATARIYHIDIS